MKSYHLKTVLRGHEIHSSLYFDNILVYSKTWHEHLTALRTVLTCLRKHGPKAKPNKCHFGYSSIEYLGLTFDSHILSLVELIDCVERTVSPSTNKRLRSFLGTLSFYRKFIPNLEDITAPLTDMLKPRVSKPLKFDSKPTDSLLKAKECLTSKPILKLPDLNLLLSGLITLLLVSVL